MKDGLHCMDCVEGMNAMDAGRVDLIVTSPPYDDLRTYGRTAEPWDFNKFRQAADAMERALKAGGVIVWIVNDAVERGGYTGTSFRHCLYFMDACGLRLHQPLIWDKTNMRYPSPNRYHPCHEWMWVLSKGRPQAVNLIRDRPNVSRGTRRTTARAADGSKEDLHESNPIEEFGARFSIWRLNPGRGQRDASAHDHPAVMPEALARDHIRTWSNPGMLVMDPFAGSGTTQRMAEEEGRRFVGFEINAEYAAEAERRRARCAGLGLRVPSSE